MLLAVSKKLPREIFTVLQRAKSELEIAKLRLNLSEKPKLLLAVSGGVDSVVLLDTFSRLQNKIPLELVALHVDHGLREDSAGDSLLVQQICEAKGLGFKSIRADEIPKGNIEAWAREFRYNFFDRCLKDLAGELLLTAHHKHDQAETLLHRLLSGRILTSSMTIAKLDRRRSLFRPFLSISKSELLEYANCAELRYNDDSTNSDLSFTRNRIRHHLVPSIEKDYNPSVVDSLSSFSERCNADEEYFAEILNAIFSKEDFLSLKPVALADTEKTPRSYSGLRIIEEAEALRWRIVQRIAGDNLGEGALGGELLGFSSSQRILSAISESIPNSDRIKKLEIPGARTVVVLSGGRFYFE